MEVYNFFCFQQRGGNSRWKVSQFHKQTVSTIRYSKYCLTVTGRPERLPRDLCMVVGVNIIAG